MAKTLPVPSDVADALELAVGSDGRGITEKKQKQIRIVAKPAAVN